MRLTGEQRRRFDGLDQRGKAVEWAKMVRSREWRIKRAHKKHGISGCPRGKDRPMNQETLDASYPRSIFVNYRAALDELGGLPVPNEVRKK